MHSITLSSEALSELKEILKHDMGEAVNSMTEEDIHCLGVFALHLTNTALAIRMRNTPCKEKKLS